MQQIPSVCGANTANTVALQHHRQAAMHSTSQSCAMHCGAIIIESAQYNANQGNAMQWSARLEQSGHSLWCSSGNTDVCVVQWCWWCLCGTVVAMMSVWCTGGTGVCVVQWWHWCLYGTVVALVFVWCTGAVVALVSVCCTGAVV